MKISCLVDQTVLEHTDCLHCSAHQLKPNCPAPTPLLIAWYKGADAEHKSLGVTQVLGCLRKAWYDKTRKEEEVYVPGSNLAAWTGTAVHSTISDAVEDWDYHLPPRDNSEGTYITEQPLFLGDDRYLLPLKGIYDCLQTYPDGHTVLYDWKTVDSFNPQYHPSADHIQQLKAYVALLRNKKVRVDAAELVYISRKEWHRVPVDLTEPMDLDWLKQRAQTLREAIQEDIRPMAEPGALCRWCAWNTPEQCKEGFRNDR